MKTDKSELSREIDLQKKASDDLLGEHAARIEKLKGENEKLRKEVEKKDGLLVELRKDYLGINHETEKLLNDQILEVKFKEKNPEIIPAELAHMDSRARQILYLQKELQRVKNEKAIEVGNIERERLLLTEKLRKEMLQKIKETKASMLAMQDEH